MAVIAIIDYFAARMKVLVTILSLLLFNYNEMPEKLPAVLSGKVIGVKDGDTIEILYRGKPVVVRLADIDCPEKKQAFGQQAKEFTSDFCFNKTVRIQQQGKPDRYKRLIGTVVVDKKVLNEELIRAGLAWHYTQYSKKSYYGVLEDIARSEKRGLWSDSRAMAPWEWRKKGRKVKV